MAFSYGIGDASQPTGQESLRIARMISSATNLQFRATGNYGVEHCPLDPVFTLPSTFFTFPCA